MILLPNELQEMFDIITFYKPIRLISKEKHSTFIEILRLVKVFLFYWLFSSALIVLVSRSISQDIFFKSGLVFLGVFLFFILQAIIGCVVAFLVSRLFSSNGSFFSLLGLNYYVLSAVSLIFLVSSVPMAEFAGLIFFLLGIGLYLFFLNELFSNFFSVSHFKSFIISVFYVLSVLLFLMLSLFFVSGQFWIHF